MSSNFNPNFPQGYTPPPANSGQPNPIHPPQGYQSYYPQQPQGGQHYNPASSQPQSGYSPQSSQPSTYVYGYTQEQRYTTPAQPNSQFNHGQPPQLPFGYIAPPAPIQSPFGAPSQQYGQYPNPPSSQPAYSGYAPSQQYVQYPNPPFSQDLSSGYASPQGYAAYPSTPSPSSSSPYGQYPTQPAYSAYAPSSQYDQYSNAPSSQPADLPAASSSKPAAIAPPSSAPSPSKPVGMAPSPKDSKMPPVQDLRLNTIVNKTPPQEGFQGKAQEHGFNKIGFFPPSPVKKEKIPNRLIDKQDYESYWADEPTSGEILYYLNAEKRAVFYKYQDVAGEYKKGDIALGDVDSRYKDILPKRSSSSAGANPQWPMEFTQKLNEVICKQIQKRYTDNLKLIKFSEANKYNVTLPYEGEVLYCVIGSVVQCKYWILEDISLSLVNKEYTLGAFFANRGEAAIEVRISDQVKLIFDLAEYLRTIKQEISNTLGTPTQRAKKSVAEKLVDYLKDRTNAKIPEFTEEEISAIDKGMFSHRLRDLVDRAKALYPDLEEMLRPASPTPRK